MSEYKPPFHITNRMLTHVSSISEKLGKISHFHNLESKPHLRKNNRIKSIHSSLKIEANSLSLNEVKDVINGHMVLGSQKEIQEVKNAYDAYEKLEDINPFSIECIKELHGIMTNKLVSESGVFRSGEEGVFSGGECIFMAPPARLVSGLMKDLFEWLQENAKEVHPLILSAIFHYEFVFIHPFSDGNGRMARLWHTAILSKWKPVFAYMPIESQIEKYQEEYYKAIADCHVAGNSDIFVEFMLEQFDLLLDDVIGQVQSYDEQMSEYEKKLLGVMEYGVPYTANAIMEQLHLKSKETFRKNYMNPVIDKGLVAMTIPDKPQSRNQRYIKT